MKIHLFLVSVLSVVVGQLPGHGEDKLQLGEYIYVKHGEGGTRPRNIEVVKLWKDDGRWKMEIKDEVGSATANVQLIEKGSHEKQTYTEFLATASMTVPGRRERERGNDNWKIVTYAMATLTLHGVIEESGSIVGVAVRTYGGQKPSVEQAKFILKPLNAHQTSEAD